MALHGSILARLQRLEAVVGLEAVTPAKIQQAAAALNDGLEAEGEAAEVARRIRLWQLEAAAADGEGGTPDGIAAAAGLANLTPSERAYCWQLAAACGEC